MQPVNVFATVDDEKQTVSHYFLSTEGANADMLLTMLFNSDDDAFAAGISEYYANGEQAKT